MNAGRVKAWRGVQTRPLSGCGRGRDPGRCLKLVMHKKNNPKGKEQRKSQKWSKATLCGIPCEYGEGIQILCWVPSWSNRSQRQMLTKK